ncbi:10226_t:CDS:2, partial [Scutellospora calospora]
MSAQLYPTLGEDLLASFKEKRFTDITITTEQGTPNAKTFRSHRFVLYSRSQYFRELLSEDDNNENIELPDISGEIFEDLLSGRVSLGHRSGSEVLELLLGAEKLTLDLVNSIQSFIIEQHGNWLNEHFAHIYHVSNKYETFEQLRAFCAHTVNNSPEVVFLAADFTCLPEKLLREILVRDDLKIDEVELWNYLLKWGLDKNSSLKFDPSLWSQDDVESLAKTLKDCLPLVRFFQFSAKNYRTHLLPYKKLLKISQPKVYDDLKNYFSMDSLRPTCKILGPRYNPIEWKRVDCVWGKTSDSFIFSFPTNDFQDAILSRVVTVAKAVSWELEYGPSFGNDLIMIGPNLQKRCLCNISNLPQVYEKQLRQSSSEFEIVDYEVYQIQRK